MGSSVENFKARVVVAGLDSNGRSTVVSDGPSETRATPAVCTVNDIWQVPSVPSNVLADNGLNGQVQLVPPPSGLTVRMGTFPPDSEWEGAEAFEEAYAAIDAPDAHVEGGDVGFHETDTVDICTVVSGEIYAVLEESEVCLKAGDSFIQRGTKHAWSNRSNEPAVVVYTMVGATR